MGPYIIKSIKADGGIDKFIHENLNSIRGTGKIFSGYLDMLKVAFPETTWSNVEGFQHKIFYQEGEALSSEGVPFAFKDLLLKKVDGLQAALSQNDNSMAKILIVKHLQTEGPRKFCNDNFPMIPHHYFESLVRLLRKIFPEMEWPSSALTLGRKNKKRDLQ